MIISHNRYKPIFEKSQNHQTSLTDSTDDIHIQNTVTINHEMNFDEYNERH